MVNKEEFRWIPGYEGIYQISNLKRVKSVARTSIYYRSGSKVKRHHPEKIITVNPTTKRLCLYKDSKSTSMKLEDLYNNIWLNNIELPIEVSGLRKVDKYNRYGYLIKTYPSVSHAAYYNCTTKEFIRSECNKNNQTPDRCNESFYKWSKTK